MTYTPLDSETLFSSVMWLGPEAVGVWYAILASKDEQGITPLNPKALAALFKCDVARVQAAWDKLAAPDPDSHNEAYEGRRIIPAKEGKWLVVSADKYRQKHSGAAYKERATVRKRKQREREAAEELPDDQVGDQATPQETPSQASVAVAFQPPECFLPEVPVKATRTDLVARGCDIWTAKWGAGSAPNGEIAGTLPKLAKHHGEEVVLTAFQRYATENTHPSPSPSDFKKHFSDWLPTGKGAGRTGARPVVRNVTEENKQALREIQQEREGREEK